MGVYEIDQRTQARVARRSPKRDQGTIRYLGGCTGRLLLGLAILASSKAIAQDHTNPATYTSASGQYELFVDHSSREGSGPASYRLARDGGTVWEAERPFGLWDAKVADDGTAAGYAYTGGVHTGGNHGTRYEGLTVVILDPTGDIRTRDTPESHDGDLDRNMWAGSDSPSVRGIILDEPRNRFVVRVPLQSNGEAPPVAWWVYELSTGRVLADVVPEFPPPSTLEDGHILCRRTDIYAELVPETPLTLVHWYTLDFTQRPSTKGAVLALLDADGKQVWSRDFPREYDGLGEDWSVYWDMLEPGIQQVTVGVRGFEFQSYSLDSRLSFSVSPDPQAEPGWSIAETVAGEDGPPTAAEADTPRAVEDVVLDFLGEIRLESGAGEPSPIGGITDFALDQEGNLGFVRHDEGGRCRFLRVSPEGEILSNLTLDLPKDDDAILPRIACVATDRWILVRSTYAERRDNAAWWLDSDTGDLDPIVGFKSGNVESLAPTGDGGFLILSKHHLKYTIQDELACYSSEGEQRWSNLEEGYGHGFNFQAATWIRDQGVAALTAVKDTIEFFDADGKHLRSVAVADLLATEPNYPAGLVADANGGLILHDFNGSPPIYRIGPEGEVTASFRPRFEDGRTFRIIGDVQAAPDGTLWTSDRFALLRLGNDGVVEKALGPTDDDGALDSILAMTVDPTGQIYAINTRTAAVHVFDRSGALLRICKPLPTDFPTDPSLGSITVDGEGSIYYHNGALSPRRRNTGYLRISADGTRLGFESLGLDTITEDWLFKPGTRERWVLGYEEIFLVDGSGDVTQTIDRRPDGDWLHHVQQGAVAPDGSLAVVSSPAGFGTRGPHSLNIYSAGGEPVRTIPLVSERGLGPVAFSGEAVVVASGEDLDIYDLDGGVVRRFTPQVGEGHSTYWYPFFSPDGSELWLHASRTTSIMRYALP